MANIEVSPEINKVLKQYAEAKGVTAEAACEQMITTAVGRLNALKKYAKKVASEKTPGAPKAKKVKAAKGPIARKAPKAKGPKARKAKAVGADVVAPAPA